jgi:hypothetical protein
LPIERFPNIRQFPIVHRQSIAQLPINESPNAVLLIKSSVPQSLNFRILDNFQF